MGAHKVSHIELEQNTDLPVLKITMGVFPFLLH